MYTSLRAIARRQFLVRIAGLFLALIASGPATRADVRDFTAAYTWSGRTVSSGYRIYVPLRAETPTIRAVVFIYPGSGGDYRYQVNDPFFQEAARALDVALIGADINGYGAIGSSNAQAEIALDAILSAAAQAVARPELINAPIASTGHSLGGFSTSMWASFFPRRVIAAVPQRGSTSPMGSDLAASLKVPYLVIVGSADSNSVTNPNTISKGDYSRWRSATAPDGHAGFAVDWTIDHDSFGNQTWALAWVYIAEALKLRYPAGQLPSTIPGQPLALNDIALANGWLGQRAYLSSSTGADRSPFCQIAPYADYAGVKTDASWLPNETVARAYQAFNSFDGVATRTGTPRQGPLAIVGAASPLVSPAPSVAGVDIPPQIAVQAAGSPIELVVDSREFDDLRAIASMRYHRGDQLLAEQTAPAADGVWRLTTQLPARGIHSFTVVATDSAGNKTAAFRPVVATAPKFSAPRYDSDFDEPEYVAGSAVAVLAEDAQAGRFWAVSGGAGANATIDAGGAGGSKRITFVDTSSATGANVAASLDLSAVASAVGGVFRIGFRASASGLTPSTANGVNFSFGTKGAFTNYGAASPSQSSSQWLSVSTDTTPLSPTGGAPTSRGFLITILTARAGATSIAFRPRQADGSTLATWEEGGDFTVSAVIDPETFAYRSIVVNGVEQIGIAKNALNGTVIPADQFFIPASAVPDMTFRFYSTSANTGSVQLDSLSLQPVLAAPASLIAKAGARPGEIALSWTPVPAAERFELQRALSEGDGFTTIAEPAAGATAWVDGGLSPGQTARYRLRAASGGEWTAFSGIASAAPFLPDSYDGWRYLAFGGAASSEKTSPAADADDDGAANLIEYLSGRSGTDAETPAAVPGVETSAGQKYLSLTFTRDPAVADGELRVEGTDDLTGEWQSLGALEPGERVLVWDGVPAAGLQTVRVRDSRPLSDPGAGRRFLRLRGVLDSGPTYTSGFESSSGYVAGYSVAGIDDALLKGAATWTAVTRSAYSPAASSANPRSGALALRLQKPASENTPVGVMLPLGEGGLDFGRRITFGFSVAINSYSAGTGNQFQVYLGDGQSFFPGGAKFWTALVFNEGEILLYKSQGAGSNAPVSLGQCTSYAAAGRYLTFTIVFDPARKVYERVTVSGPSGSADFTPAVSGATLPWLPGTPGDPPPLLMFLAGTNDALNVDIDDILLTNPLR